MAEKVKAEVVSTGNNKAALTAFILSLIGLVGTFTGIASIILGAIALSQCKKAGVVTEKPYVVFRRVAKPVAIIDLVLGIIAVVTLIILLATGVFAAWVQHNAI